MKRRLIFIAIAGFIIIGILFYVVYFNPRIAFKRTFGCELPDSAVIVNYEHIEHLFLENVLYFKVSLNESDYDRLKKEFSEILVDAGFMEMTEDDFIPNMEYNCSWWDLNDDEIQLGYYAMQSGKKGAKTVILYVFFAESAEGEYYIYASN